MSTKANGFRSYDAYRFTSKDPAIDAFRTVAQDYFRKRILIAEDYRQIEEQGGPTAGCIKQWLVGKTRRPQNATLEAAGRALGYQRVWRRMGKNTP
jgi:hypothetical protein